MQTITINVGLPTDVDRRIQDLAIWRGKSWERIIIGAIKAAYFVKTQWDNDRLIYQDDRIIDIDWPQEFPLKPFNSMQVSLAKQVEQSFRQTYTSFGLKDYSIVNWGLDCLVILEDALLLNQVYGRKPGHQTVPFDIRY